MLNAYRSGRRTAKDDKWLKRCATSSGRSALILTSPNGKVEAVADFKRALAIDGTIAEAARGLARPESATLDAPMILALQAAHQPQFDCSGAYKRAGSKKRLSAIARGYPELPGLADACSVALVGVTGLE